MLFFPLCVCIYGNSFPCRFLFGYCFEHDFTLTGIRLCPWAFFMSSTSSRLSVSVSYPCVLFQVLAGSYFSVAGALVGILKPGRMSMFGTLLIIWGLVKEGILGKPANTDPAKAVYVYPTMLIALVCAFSAVKYDMKKVVRSAPPRPIAKPLQRSSKSKLKWDSRFNFKWCSFYC